MGEGPGESENIEGIPFAGESGYTLNGLIDLCLKQTCRAGTLDEEFGGDYDIPFDDKLTTADGADRIIGGGGSDVKCYVEAVHQDYPSPTIGITNIIGCIPWKIDNFAKVGTRPTTKVEANACKPRLVEIIQLCKPKAIVCLGKEAVRFLPKPKDGLPSSVQYIEEVVHPSHLNRLQKDDPIQYQESRNRTILTLVRLKRRLWGIEE